MTTADVKCAAVHVSGATWEKQTGSWPHEIVKGLGGFQPSQESIIKSKDASSGCRLWLCWKNEL
jgi:hypothetical protein